MRPRAEVTDALIEAAARLYAERPAAEVTVRAIAAEAGVNHGLITRYFGSKEGLILAVLEQAEERNAALASAVTDLRQDSGMLLASLLRQPEIVSLVARLSLDGDLPRREAGFPHLYRLVENIASLQEASGSRPLDPRLVFTCALALALGYAAFGDFLRNAARLDDEPPEWVESQVAEGLRLFLQAAV